ncbi:hypothetical protein ACFVT5_10145 [Streptomyces sp. NPDC058001]|uniref:hypothetical protein n=1 Tax=Streptomyces sp. NPDC058001 TaxID=3346300 RepID=UPI0036EB2C83
MSATSHAGRTRHTGHPLLLLGQRVVMGSVAVLLLIAGVWASWGTAQHVMLTKGRERGTMTVARCDADACTGSYAPGSAGSSARERVVLDQSVGAHKGDRIAVTVKPDSDQVVRTGPTGLLRAWAPLGGGLLLAAVVVAGGLRMPRTAWVTAAAGGVLLAAAVATI